jgi:PAS domain S-box-containing protein
VHQIELELQNEELLRVQLELTDFRDKYVDLYDFAPVGYLTLNDQGQILEANLTSPSCERISGYQPEEFLKQPSLLREIILPEDRETWDTHECEAQDRPALREFQFRIQRPDGTIRWIEHCCQPVVADSGKFLGVRASNRDITSRKEMELKLEEALANVERLKAQFEADYNYLQEEIKFELGFDQIVGESEALKEVLVNGPESGSPRYHGLDFRGDRHRQGAHRPGHPQRQPTGSPAPGKSGLGRAQPHPHRERAFRP